MSSGKPSRGTRVAPALDKYPLVPILGLEVPPLPQIFVIRSPSLAPGSILFAGGGGRVAFAIFEPE